MENLIRILHEEQCSCVIRSVDGCVVRCHGRGISDLLRLYRTEPRFLKGAEIADRVVGKGAAALMIIGGVSRVYADIISDAAVDLFEKSGVDVSWSKRVPEIINRTGNGRCPVETLTLSCTTAQECLPLIENFVNSMKNNSIPAKVFMTREINPESIIRLYHALGREAKGNVAVKISTGEPGGHNFLKPELISDFVKLVNGTIVECNTAYEGRRNTSEEHYRAAEEHGFTAIAPVDIMDSEGEIKLPVKNGRHLPYDIVGSHYTDYAFTVILSHFKGHQMGGFGGAVKNMSIGIASSVGKAFIHTAGKRATCDDLWDNIAPQNDFLESMAEAAKAIADHCGENIIYISVANNLSVDCDCASDPEDPKMADIGILASLDPIALDKACTDLVRTSPDHGKVHLIERIDSRNGMHTLEYGEAIGLGTQTYDLIEL